MASRKIRGRRRRGRRRRRASLGAMSHPDAPPLDARREGFLAGAVIGAALAARTAAGDATTNRGAMDPLSPPGRRHAAVALGAGLLEALPSGGVDLRRLAGRWVEWSRSDGHGADPALVQALDHLAEFDAPAPALAHAGAAAVAAALPAALAAASPRAMVSGAFHTARLVDPDPAGGLAAVAVVVAAARLLEGSRDFLPDVLGLLRANNADEEFFARFRAIAADPRNEPPRPTGTSVRASVVAVWVLWQVQHRPRGVEALRALGTHRDLNGYAGAALGALLGARDGIADWPREWIDGAGEDVVLRCAAAGRLAMTERVMGDG